MPGTHIPPAVPMHPSRRQSDYHYGIPPQTHSPVHHNPYAQYHHPQQHYVAPHAPPYPQQWYYPQPPLPQYPMPPRPFHPQASPVVVSSHPHMPPMPPVNRAVAHTPPIVHSRTPPAPRNQTPQPLPSTPSATSQTFVSSPTPPTNMTTPTPPPSTPSAVSQSSTAAPPPAPVQTHRMPYYPQLPWLSVPDQPFPPRASQKKRRRRAPVAATEEGLAFPSREQAAEEQVEELEKKEEVPEEAEQTPTEEPDDSQTSTIAAASEIETPSTSHPPSEIESTQPTPPAASMPPPQSRPAGTTHTRTATRPVIPLVPIRSARAPSVASATQKSVTADKNKEEPQKEEGAATTPEATPSAEETPKASLPPKPAQPKSWAELLRTKPASAPAHAPTVLNGAVPAHGATVSKTNSLADVLASFSIDSDKRTSFLEPRGLVNSGNLCYMNSILQVLLFCVPFYDFLDQVAKRAAHNFKSDTPLVDAMIMFMRDFKPIDSAVSVEQLRMRLKDTELEQYGDPLAPEYVYDVIKRLPRFDNMKRGQQEDAEEFLGFLLAGLHDECAQVIKSAKGSVASTDALSSPRSDRSGSVDSGWLEVGPKQKASTTQSSGAIEVDTPITKIFGGKLRSEYRKPGEKPSVTLEPYQPLQLDISSPIIHNITDALKAMTHLETLDNTNQATRSSTKQVFIETLPPVLILHLKRFHYDAKGPQKIWKKIGYPLELEIPKEVFPQHKRGSFGVHGGFPRYRLTAVVYHHGKNASGGHYTVDLRRQEGREWVRLDDTVIRRVRAQDVAEGGAEEDPKVLAAALEQHKKDAGKNKNFFEQAGFDEDGEKADEGGWSHVNGTDNKGKDTGAKKWSGVVNGTATPSTTGKRTPLPKESVRDNKVAYILFYQRIET